MVITNKTFDYAPFIMLEDHQEDAYVFVLSNGVGYDFG